MTLTRKIKQKALDLGFDLVGITDTSPLPPDQKKAFNDWLCAGYEGRMAFMHKNIEKRFNPSLQLPNARSVIVVGLNYKPFESAPRPCDDKPTGTVVTYSCYQDYHSFIENLLRKLTEFITTLTDSKPQFKIFIDSAHLAERALAVRAGLGFIGKNHMVINPDLGPQIFLGELITTLELGIDSPIDTDCGNCTKCISACHTGALRPDGFLDASRCINDLTIENKLSIAPDLAGKIGARIFGCEECILVCPYHKTAPACSNKDFKFYPDAAQLDLLEILDMTGSEFETRFADSPIYRLGLERLKSNAKTCLKNINASQ